MKRRVLALLLLSALCGLVYVIGWSSILTVSSREITTKDPKNVLLIERELTRAGVDFQVGDPLARINTRAIERTLKLQPWVGEVRLERKWFDGSVQLFVGERIPKFMVRQSSQFLTPTVPTSREQFMTASGELFELPGNLALEYKNLPEIELRSTALSLPVRAGAAGLIDSLGENFDVSKVIITGISTYITEGRYKVSGFSEGNMTWRQIRISWGTQEELATKETVVKELLNLKANRGISRIDVSNPRLPIVSRN